MRMHETDRMIIVGKDVLKFLVNSTIPEKRVETRSKFSPPSTFNFDNQVISALVVGKKRHIFQH